MNREKLFKSKPIPKVAAFLFLLLPVTVLLNGCGSVPVAQVQTQEEIDYFLEIAFGTEYGESEARILKWNADVHIQVFGDPTPEDLASLSEVIFELNNLIQGLELTIVPQDPNITIHFLPEDHFKEAESNYVPVNFGFFWTYWHNENLELYSANILIASDQISQLERSHLIREELTQSLGLMNDSDKYDKSIFFTGWTETQKYSELDQKVIRTLYSPDVKSGMTIQDVMKRLQD